MDAILLERIGMRASDLAKAYQINDAAFAAHERADAEYLANPCEVNAHALVEKEAAWDDARDEIIQKVQYLMGTLSLMLAASPNGAHPALAAQHAYLKEAITAEVLAFNRYTLHGTMEYQQLWQDARGEIASRARPLADLVKKIIVAAFESATPTEIDSHAAQN